MELVDAIRHAIDGNAVLFVGSGFSFGAKNLSNSSPMTGRAFARHLYALAGVTTDDDNLALASQLYAQKVGAAKLAELCRDAFSIRAPADHHKALLAIPWQRIYTTNYDDLVEKSAAEVGVAISPVTLDDTPEKYLSNARVCLHINGLISNLSPMDFVGGFKLTAASYLQDAFTNSPWSSVLRQDFRLARAVFFIGYSMYDLDIQRIVHSEDTKDKTFFITAPSTDVGPDSVFLPTFGSVRPIGIENLVGEFKAVNSDYVPIKLSDEFLAIEKIDRNFIGKVPSNADLERLFLYGVLDFDLIGNFSDLKVDRHYLVDRVSRLKVESTLLSGDDVVFTSDLGNGKTVAIEQTVCDLISRGWNVFRISSDTKESRKEALRALNIPGKSVFVIDNYIPFLDFIDFISIRRSGKNIKFLLSARSHVHDAFLDRLENALRTQRIAEFDINRLVKAEAESVVELIGNFGLWADFSAKSDIEKYRLVTTDCDSQLHQVLLKIYRSPHIASKISDLFSSIAPSVRRIAIAAFVIRGSGLSSDRRLINDLLKGSPLVRLSNSDKDSVKFLWDDSAGHIKLRSSVLAEYYLTNLGDAAEVVDVLVEMYFQALEMRTVSREYEYFIRSIMGFSALQKMLPKSGLRPATIKFYEAIQNTVFTKKNPHYWLQYAIARLSFDDSLEEIAPYFQSAYAFATLSNYDTYQIDNHFGRFLLMKAVREKDVCTAFDLYSQAKAILLKQTLHEKKHYPYRVAIGVRDFFMAHGSNMEQRQKQDVNIFCSEVLERINKLPASTRVHRHVIACQAAMKGVLADLQLSS